MRRILTAAGFVALVVLPAAPAMAEPSGKCGGGAFAFSASGGAVCITSGPLTGSVEVRTTGGGNGYIVADGDSTNQSLPGNCLDGYVGFQNGGGFQGVVSSSNGDYTYGPQPAPAPPTVPPCT